MKLFSTLLRELSQTTSTNAKVTAIEVYFTQAAPEDKNWAMYILCGNTLKRRVSSTLLRSWIAEITSLPPWLVEESYHVVGDLAETLALLNPYPGEQSDHSLSWWMNFLGALDDMNIDERKAQVIAAWQKLGPSESWVFNKMITGGLRIGVAKSLVIRSLGKLTGLATDRIALRLGGRTKPEDFSFEHIASLTDDPSKSSEATPYPFYLAYPLGSDPETLGEPDEWCAEWKWDGIRAQIVKRGNVVSIWSRGDELLTESFPDLAEKAAEIEQDVVIDGELIGWSGESPLPFAALQKRIMRKRPTPILLREIPVGLLAYDILEFNGGDLREHPFIVRREILQALVGRLPSPHPIKLSPLLFWDSWEELKEQRSRSRTLMAEGLMLKRKQSQYLVGRRRGDWWKWKVDPFSVDAVLVYAQKGHGRRADLFTDYTFALWKDNTLVPFAKAYSGLTDEEIKQVDRWIRGHTKEKFGPVRTVEQELVFEIAFEGLQVSKRHKSGLAVRFPRIVRWRTDKGVKDADSIDTLVRLAESGTSKA